MSMEVHWEIRNYIYYKTIASFKTQNNNLNDDWLGISNEWWAVVQMLTRHNISLWILILAVYARLIDRKFEKNHFVLPRFNLDIGRNSLRYRGPIAWELTPTAIKQSTSLKNFKNLLKQHRHKLFIKNISFLKEACMVSHKNQDYIYF